MPIWPFQRSRADEDAERLLAAVTEVSRQPAFFGEERVPDTLDGRFELITVHAALALMRLGKSAEARPMAQTFTDRLFSAFDAGLREAAVGDTSVPKRMHKLAGDFYGRLDAYGTTLNEPKALEAALSRNVWHMPSHPFAGALARHVEQTASVQDQAPISSMFSSEGWPRL
jgi:cytochrome b pre-mRNA-processing protein 3